MVCSCSGDVPACDVPVTVSSCQRLAPVLSSDVPVVSGDVPFFLHSEPVTRTRSFCGCQHLGQGSDKQRRRERNRSKVNWLLVFWHLTSCVTRIFLLQPGLYFVVRWLDDGDDVIFDTLSSKDIVSPEGVDVLNLSSGDKCSALFKGHEYQVEIIACGELLAICVHSGLIRV